MEIEHGSKGVRKMAGRLAESPVWSSRFGALQAGGGPRAEPQIELFPSDFSPAGCFKVDLNDGRQRPIAAIR